MRVKCRLIDKRTIQMNDLISAAFADASHDVYEHDESECVNSLLSLNRLFSVLLSPLFLPPPCLSPLFLPPLCLSNFASKNIYSIHQFSQIRVNLLHLLHRFFSYAQFLHLLRFQQFFFSTFSNFIQLALGPPDCCTLLFVHKTPTHHIATYPNEFMIFPYVVFLCLTNVC